MRGTRFGLRSQMAQSGIIPAGAGHTGSSCIVHSCSRDHPRRCGAHACTGWQTLFAWGSSPRVRGTQSCIPSPCGAIGIIPAGAGHTETNYGWASRDGDHPRGCGAHIGFDKLIYFSEGSSPRVRGTLALIVSRHKIIGIIPAGAGHTCTTNNQCFGDGDHPRGCGAHEYCCIDIPHGRGSSPRVRGTHKVEKIFRDVQGIIPAGAGHTHASH